jgi:multidrug transporter EmrE-like cation transporter
MMSIAMRNGPNGIAWAVIQSGMVVPFLVGTIAFGEKAGFTRFVGLGLLLVALALFARARDNSPQVQGNRKIWLLTSGADFFCVGLIQTLNNLPSYFQAADTVSTVSRTFALQVGAVGAWLLLSAFHPRQAVRGFTRGALLLGVVMAVNAILSGFFIQYYGQNILAQSGFGAVASPITSASCLIWFTLYSTVFLKEKLSLPSRLALAFCIVGVVLMSLQWH